MTNLDELDRLAEIAKTGRYLEQLPFHVALVNAYPELSKRLKAAAALYEATDNLAHFYRRGDGSVLTEQMLVRRQDDALFAWRSLTQESPDANG